MTSVSRVVICPHLPCFLSLTLDTTFGYLSKLTIQLRTISFRLGGSEDTKCLPIWTCFQGTISENVAVALGEGEGDSAPLEGRKFSLSHAWIKYQGRTWNDMKCQNDTEKTDVQKRWRFVALGGSNGSFFFGVERYLGLSDHESSRGRDSWPITKGQWKNLPCIQVFLFLFGGPCSESKNTMLREDGRLTFPAFLLRIWNKNCCTWHHDSDFALPMTAIGSG